LDHKREAEHFDEAVEAVLGQRLIQLAIKDMARSLGEFVRRHLKFLLPRIPLPTHPTMISTDEEVIKKARVRCRSISAGSEPIEYTQLPADP
jgi:hypothetical protein